MPITSIDYLMKRTTSGFTYRTEWQYVTGASAFVAARTYDLSSYRGLYGNNTYANTNGDGVWVSCNSSSSFALPLGQEPGIGETKHILLASAMSSVATGVPGNFILMDLQGYWPTINCATNAVQTLSGSPNLRYANGQGCQMYTVVTTATGTGAQNIAVSYTNQDGTTGRSLGGTVGMVVSNIVGAIPYASTGATNSTNGFLPLSGSDTGVANVESVTMSAASTAGNMALCIGKPLLSIPVFTAAILNERDYATQLPSLPKIENDACLVWLYQAGAATIANSNFYGTLESVWG